MTPFDKAALAEAPVLAVGVVLDIDPTKVAWWIVTAFGFLLTFLLRREWRRFQRRLVRQEKRLSALERGERPPPEIDDDP